MLDNLAGQLIETPNEGAHITSPFVSLLDPKPTSTNKINYQKPAGSNPRP